MNVQVVRYADRPELDASWDDVVGSAWPDFMLHDPTVNELWGLLYDEAPDCRLYLLDRDTGEVLAHGNSFRWPGTARSRIFPMTGSTACSDASRAPVTTSAKAPMSSARCRRS
jgi:hypothetical protein